MSRLRPLLRAIRECLPGLLIPPILATVADLTSTRSLLALGLLLFAPLGAGLGVHLACLLGFSRRFPAAISLFIGLLTAGLLVHRPPHSREVERANSPEFAHLQRCAELPRAPAGELHLLTWTLDPEGPPPDIGQLAETQAGIYVLSGLPTGEFGEALAGLVGGEATRVGEPGDPHALDLVVRGALQLCGGAEDLWEMPLSHPAGVPNLSSEARLNLAFPAVEGVGVFPMLISRLDGPGSPAEWPSWPLRLDAGAHQSAAVARTLGPERIIFLGDLRVPRSFRGLGAWLAGAGLHEARLPAHWPARLGPLPFLPVHDPDRLWLGDHWHLVAAETGPEQGHSRKPLSLHLRTARTAQIR